MIISEEERRTLCLRMDSKGGFNLIVRILDFFFFKEHVLECCVVNIVNKISVQF